MSNEINLADLKEPFHPDEIEWRIAQSGFKADGTPWAQVIPYVQSRAIMDRLDDICGPENWFNEYVPGPDGGVLCRISIRINGEWISKEDAAENTNIEGVKGGISGAFKRAAVPWGICRYLYRIKTDWASFAKKGRYSSLIKDKKTGRGEHLEWNPPKLPPWALPQNGTKGVNYSSMTSEDWEEQFDREVKALEQVEPWRDEHRDNVKKMPRQEVEKLLKYVKSMEEEFKKDKREESDAE